MDQYQTYPRPDVDTVIRFDEKGHPYLTTEPVPERAPVVVSRGSIVEPAGLAPTIVYQPAQPYYGPPAEAPAYNPLRDPIIMRLLAGGAVVGGGAIALSFALAALAAATTALGLLLAVLLLIWAMTSGKSGGKATNIHITNTNKARYRR